MISVSIKKPLFKVAENVYRVGVWDLYLNKSIRDKTPLIIRVNISQKFDERIWREGTVDPKEWIKTGELIPKVFLRENEPMQLWYNNIKVEEPKSPEQKAKEAFLKYLA